MKQHYKIGFKSLIRKQENNFILNRSYNLHFFSQFKHKGISRILILIPGGTYA
jgi:hypothetical protein